MAASPTATCVDLMSFTHETYLGPFSWRYGSEAMRHHLVRGAQTPAVAPHLGRAGGCAAARRPRTRGAGRRFARHTWQNVDIERSHALEETLRHDLMAEVALLCGTVSLSAAASSIWAPPAWTLRTTPMCCACARRWPCWARSLRALLVTLAQRAAAEADHVCIAWTHLQPAEPTTVGYRLAGYAQDLLADYEALCELRAGSTRQGLQRARSARRLPGSSCWKAAEFTPLQLETDIMERARPGGFPGGDANMQPSSGLELRDPAGRHRHDLVPPRL